MKNFLAVKSLRCAHIFSYRPDRSFIIMVFVLKIKFCGMDKRQAFLAWRCAFLHGSPSQTPLYARPIVQNRELVQYRKSILPPRPSLPEYADKSFRRQRSLQRHTQKRDTHTRQWIKPARIVENHSKWI